MRPLREMLGLSTAANDIHSGLNRTPVKMVIRPRSAADVVAAVRNCREKDVPLAISGGRHSMGGQQFLSDGFLLDMRSVKGLSRLDQDRGIAIVGAGALWPGLYTDLRHAQGNNDFGWTYRQKQTGGDRLSLGGSISSNIHSRGLTMRPMVEDVEALHVIKPDGTPCRVSRSENPELWPFLIGGYGLFAVIVEVELRLARRRKIRRRVEIRGADGLIGAFDEMIRADFEFGDFQFAIDENSDSFLRRGVFACYEPVEDSVPIRADQKETPRRAWHYLVHLAHTNKSEAFRLYETFYRSTDGQIYWSDLHQMTPYLDGYHRKLDRRVHASCPGSEMITELYVPRASLEDFLGLCRSELSSAKASVIYGTVRLVEPDTETFLPWATQNWACVIFNLHVDHDPAGLAKAQSAFRMLIDIAQSFGGSFYLTYHRWATREQVEQSYPQMAEFLEHKRRMDPQQTLQSDWYRHMLVLFDLA